ncbi:ATP synthase F1 subunit delta [soil metagenome]
MIETRVAYRYAKSLIDLSIERGQLDQVREDMQLVFNTIRASHEFAVMLKSPVIKTDKKQEILKAIFGGKIGVISSEFIDIITRKHRERELEGIADSFLTQYKINKKILTAVITTASGLDKTLRDQVLQIVKGSTSSEVELTEQINKELIGGFVLRIGDQQVDASIIRQIKNLDRTFSENPYIREV